MAARTGVENRSKRNPARLAAAPPEPVALPDIINLNNVESIDSIVIGGEPRLLLMSDEGNEKKNRPARYMMLEYDQLGR